jgi:hypothetical protein
VSNNYLILKNNEKKWYACVHKIKP